MKKISVNENFYALKAISPIDGRYGKVTAVLSDYFSEAALIRYRVFVEIEYFIALYNLNLPQLVNMDKNMIGKLRAIYTQFKDQDALRVKEIEQTTNHDVKAVEYFIKEQFDQLGIPQFKEFIHFGLTSQDVNNTAVPYSIKEAHSQVLLPALYDVVAKLSALADEWKAVPMLARTHGQPASPTVLGKEIKVFIERVNNQMNYFETIPFSAKFGGATGNFNAHYVAFPKTNWIVFANNFVDGVLGLKRLQMTTQIEHYDHFAAYCANVKRINNILLNLSRDMWTYISMDYFKQKIKKEEVGSSAMPHKVNPIDFENAEGNFGVANAVLDHLANKLPISRLQRDLTDSTVLRNIGVPIAHSLIGYRSLLRGLNKVILNESVIDYDLEKNWAVVAEAIQTVLRREGYKNPYEALKELTRANEPITRETMQRFIDNLAISPIVKEELKQITPQNYTGVFPG